MRLFESITRALRPDRPRRPSAPARRLRVEGLEDRRLLTLGLPFAVDNPASVPASDPATASAANGMSVVVWTRHFGINNVDDQVRAQLYAANGAKIGGEITVAGSIRDEFDPAVAMDANGNFVVTWTEMVNGQPDVYARLYTNTGQPAGNRITVAANPFGLDEYGSDVAMDADGDFVVSYTVGDGTDEDVFANRYGRTGGFNGFVPVANTNIRDEYNSSVAMTPAGEFVVAYERRFETNFPNVMLNRYNATGALKTTNGVVNIATTPAFEYSPDVAVDRFGNAVVVYDSFSDAPNGDTQLNITAKRVNAAGQVTTTIPIESTLFSSGVHSFNPSVAVSRDTGSFVVAYNKTLLDNSGGVGVAEVSGVTNSVVDRHLVTADSLVPPSVSMDANGNYLLGYAVGSLFQDTNHIEGRRGRRV
jgi:hypothetical protein